LPRSRRTALSSLGIKGLGAALPPSPDADGV